MPVSACRTCNSTSSISEDYAGWTLESPGRGTLTVVITCLFTTFLCTWIVIHPRVDRRTNFRLFHKVALFLKTIVAPELIAVEGAQEWTQSRKMIRQCAEYTNGEFKLVHAFYISMLAIRYQTENGAKVIWPNQYTWLLEQGLISWSDYATWGLSLENIKDKSNADATAKAFALVQVAWYVAQCVMRAVHDLPLAPLETMTLSYIPLFTITYFFWWTKPKDITTPSLVNLPPMSPEQMVKFESIAISSAFDEENSPQQTSYWLIWYLTPRVFEKEAEEKALQEAEELAKRIENKNVKERQISIERPINLQKHIVVAHWDPDLYHSKMWPITCLFGASFGALHLISWDAAFPTLAELWLWRAAAITSIVTMLVFMQYEKVELRWGGLLTILSIVSPGLYLLSRLVMMGGVIAAFRASDPKIYETYVVSTYWVHLM